MTVKTGELTLPITVKRTRLHRTMVWFWPLVRRIPVLSWITKKILFRGVLFQVGNMPWRRLRK